VGGVHYNLINLVMKIKDILSCLVVVILFQGVTMAQDTLLISPAKIDSLHQLIVNRKNNDEEKVRLLNEYARLCFFNQEFKLGLVSAREALEISKKLDYRGGEIMFNMTLSAFQGSGVLYSFYLQRARNLDLKANNQFSEFTAELNIPIGYPSDNDEFLLRKLTPLLQYFEDLDDKEIQLTLMSPIISSYYRLGRTDEVKINIRKFAELSQDLKLFYPSFVAYSNLKMLFDSEGNTEEAKKIEQEIINLLSMSKDNNETALLNFIQGNNYTNMGQYAISIDYYLKSIDAYESVGDLNMLLEIYNPLGYAYETLEMQDKALEVYEKLISLTKELNINTRLYTVYTRPVFPLYELKRYDEARNYMALALQGTTGQVRTLLEAKSNSLEGQISLDQGAYAEAISYLQKTYETYSKIVSNNEARYTISFTLLYLTESYYKMGDFKNALKNALECLERENQLNNNRTIIKNKISFLISEIYIEMRQPEKAFDYIKMYQEIIKESNKAENANRVAEAQIRSIINKSEKQIDLLEKEKLQKIQESKIQRVWIFSISIGLISLLILAFILFRNNKLKQKANALLQEQKEKIQSTLEKLKSTQAQLIQSEKMASLGELTAGIAHEIQNPLNFVNNFSELNKELVLEASEELGKGDFEEAKAILKDIGENSEKINHHGKRADTIVKGMLAHSRTSTGEKIPTDINALADEYLRLSYHGLRAKDKSFSADYKTDFDPNLPKVSVVPQDIGRVLLNLINNAFQAINNDELRMMNDEFKPLVTVATKNLGDKIEISVKDNGPGIPDAIKDKIFQPFFTTKPTGQGTGLGLSLSYDIVKAHGGELEIETAMNKGTKFSIKLNT